MPVCSVAGALVELVPQHGLAGAQVPRGMRSPEAPASSCCCCLQSRPELVPEAGAPVELVPQAGAQVVFCCCCVGWGGHC